MKSIDNMFRGNADSGDEELSARIDYYTDELIEFALGIVIAKAGSAPSRWIK